MPIFRVEKTRNYTVMSNYHLKDKNLSFKAKGLLSYMLSLPDTWDFSLNGLCSASKDNITSIRSTLKELQSFQYLQVKKLMPNITKSGRIEYEYIIYEKPYEIKQSNEKNNKKQDIGFLYLENLSLENDTLINTNKVNTKKNIKKRKKESNFQQRNYSSEELENLYKN